MRISYFHSITQDYACITEYSLFPAANSPPGLAPPANRSSTGGDRCGDSRDPHVPGECQTQCRADRRWRNCHNKRCEYINFLPCRNQEVRKYSRKSLGTRLYLLLVIVFRCSVCGTNGPLKSSYKKCRFAAFLRCLRTAAVLVPTHNFTLLPPFYPLRHAREKKYQAHSCAKVKRACGPAWNEATM